MACHSVPPETMNFSMKRHLAVAITLCNLDNTNKCVLTSDEEFKTTLQRHRPQMSTNTGSVLYIQFQPFAVKMCQTHSATCLAQNLLLSMSAMYIDKVHTCLTSSVSIQDLRHPGFLDKPQSQKETQLCQLEHSEIDAVALSRSKQIKSWN